MRDILISAGVCLACLMVALISQLVTPTVVEAAPPEPTTTLATALAAPGPADDTIAAVLRSPVELDPDDSNPALFAMAPSDDAPTLAQANALGGEMSAPKPRTTASGLQITDLVVGEGEEATAGRTVSVNYRGTLQNGKEFDSSYGRGPFSFPLGAGRVIKGWDEGVAGMKVGGKRQLVIPPDLAYGSRGAGGVIPPDATLLFDVELLEVGR
ncbi:MAG: FKBP-type peptidyl-prolyl cis-trans isomerase [Cyanobacteriota bacterium]|nr:FKBP-type peptidyl-prolyl cis-trans isomerase [Cyanobacteriota bacterium]